MATPDVMQIHFCYISVVLILKICCEVLRVHNINISNLAYDSICVTKENEWYHNEKICTSQLPCIAPRSLRVLVYQKCQFQSVCPDPNTKMTNDMSLLPQNLC
ncbi:unnamed protein product [Meganyctiphanes norvegica]|uniref:Uncharacterized protein n=1 Tax=Meganyctiphanes norvegica TaxID=48144 RepID=A0AAV2RN08_MEGNR